MTEPEEIRSKAESWFKRVAAVVAISVIMILFNMYVVPLLPTYKLSIIETYTPLGNKTGNVYVKIDQFENKTFTMQLEVESSISQEINSVKEYSGTWEEIRDQYLFRFIGEAPLLLDKNGSDFDKILLLDSMTFSFKMSSESFKMWGTTLIPNNN